MYGRYSPGGCGSGAGESISLKPSPGTSFSYRIGEEKFFFSCWESGTRGSSMSGQANLIALPLVGSVLVEGEFQVNSKATHVRGHVRKRTGTFRWKLRVLLFIGNNFYSLLMPLRFDRAERKTFPIPCPE